MFPANRATPLVTVLDGHPHTLAFLSATNHVPSVNLGVDGFGQAGALAETSAYHHVDADAIVTSCLDPSVSPPRPGSRPREARALAWVTAGERAQTSRDRR